MLTPMTSAIILLVLSVLLLVVVPAMDGSKRFARYISLRYTLVSVFTIMAVGCILNFSHLADSSRDIVLCGACALIVVFCALRSFEKCKLFNKDATLSFKRGDMEATLDYKGSKPTSTEEVKDGESK